MKNEIKYKTIWKECTLKDHDRGQSYHSHQEIDKFVRNKRKRSPGFFINDQFAIQFDAISESAT